MANYLVTGGAGFVGSHLVEALLHQNERVRVLDNFATGKAINLAPVQEVTNVADQLEVVTGDIRSYHIVHEAMQGIDYVFHEAALPSVPRSVNDPITSNEVNVVGTLNLLHAAHKAGVKRFIFASSSSIYGNSLILPKVETMAAAPRSPYAITKLTGEMYCRTFWELYGLETVCLRYFNVFGPRQDPASYYSAVIPKFIMAALSDQPITIYGDGEQSRDFTYIHNVVHANLLACHAPKAAGQVINVSCGERYSLHELVQKIQHLLGRPVKIRHCDPRAGDVKHSQADIEQAGQLLGYEPLVHFQEGLTKTLNWYQHHA